MLKKIKVVPLAAESLGVRSMCTFVETSDVKILLDAGVSLCPNRFGLPPHPTEYKAIINCRRKIAEVARDVDVVTISHYHFDHHTPSYTDWLCNWSSNEVAQQIYQEKTVLMKNPKAKINFSQRRRGWVFQKTGGKQAESLETADGKVFTFGGTKVKFSEPVFHGPEDSALGWILMAAIECEDEKFLFAPDVQGPMCTSTLKIILEEKPRLVMIGGPPLYLAGFKVNEQLIHAGIANLEEIVEEIPDTILEHHILRDEKWQEHVKPALEKAAMAKHKIFTAAELLNEENRLLEACRRRLFAEEPPSKEFERWMRLPISKRKLVQPPV